MGFKLNQMSLDAVTKTAEALVKIAGQLTTAVASLDGVPPEKILLPWSQRQYTSLDVLVDAGNEMEKAAKTIALAESQKRPSKQQQALQRRVTQQMKRDAEKGQQDRKSIGRPRKKST